MHQKFFEKRSTLGVRQSAEKRHLCDGQSMADTGIEVMELIKIGRQVNGSKAVTVKSAVGDSDAVTDLSSGRGRHRPV